VEDANSADAKGNRLVKEFGLTSYAGVPLAVKSGYKIGTLCVMDHPSRRFRAQELEILESLAALVVDRLELCRSAREAREARDAATRNDKATLRTTTRLVNEGRLLASIVQSSQDAIVSKDLNGVVTSWNPAAEKIFGYSATEMIGRSITRIIPTERLDEETRILESIKRGQRIEHFETVRRRKDGTLVPISLTISPIKDDGDEVLGASKIARDISAQVESNKRISTLLREVNHRVKNQFAVVLSMIGQTAGRSEALPQFEAKIRERIMALARSHDLLVNRNWAGVPANDVLQGQIRGVERPGRITASGPEILLSPMAVQYLGMAFHELVRNAELHGVLAVPTGRVEVRWEIFDRRGVPWFALTWTESGGARSAAVGRGGFGKTMVERITPAAIGGLGRLIEQHNGLRWELQAPLAQMESRD
jgi:PAS domain S-box-containing protein